MRQRTKRWGFDLGGQYITGIAKQELEDQPKISTVGKLIASKPKKPKYKKSEDIIAMMNPFRK